MAPRSPHGTATVYFYLLDERFFYFGFSSSRLMEEEGEAGGGRNGFEPSLSLLVVSLKALVDSIMDAAGHCRDVTLFRGARWLLARQAQSSQRTE